MEVMCGKRIKRIMLPVDLSKNFETKMLLSGATLFYGVQSTKEVNNNVLTTRKLIL